MGPCRAVCSGTASWLLPSFAHGSFSSFRAHTGHESKDSVWSPSANTNTAEFAAQHQPWQTGVTLRLQLVRKCWRDSVQKIRRQRESYFLSITAEKTQDQALVINLSCQTIKQSVLYLILQHRWCNNQIIAQNECNHTDGASNNQGNLGILYQEVMGYF